MNEHVQFSDDRFVNDDDTCSKLPTSVASAEHGPPPEFIPTLQVDHMTPLEVEEDE